MDHRCKFFTSSGMRLDSKFSATFDRLLGYRPEVVFVILGGSDIHPACSVMGIVSSLISVRQRLLDRGAKRVFISGIEARGKTLGLTPKVYTKIRRSIHKKLSKILGSDFVDLNKVWHFPVQYDQNDLVHPGAKEGGCASLLGLIHRCLHAGLK